MESTRLGEKFSEPFCCDVAVVVLALREVKALEQSSSSYQIQHRVAAAPQPNDDEGAMERIDDDDDRQKFCGLRSL